MGYDYIARTYGVRPLPGQRVRHQETGRFGTVRPVNASALHHVAVKFDGDRFALPCHPKALDYFPAEQVAA